jgi:hypothetical protein
VDEQAIAHVKCDWPNGGTLRAGLLRRPVLAAGVHVSSQREDHDMRAGSQ